MAEPLSLRFEGPFSWTGEGRQCIAEYPLVDSAGVYLWTVQTDVGELVKYVGQAGRFRKRFEDHLTEQLAGKYAVEDTDALRHGRLIHLWPGVYGPNTAASRQGFVARLTEFAVPLQEYIRTVRFYLAVTTASGRTRCRAEAAISRHLAAQPAPVGSLLDPAVRYQHPRWESEEPLEIRLSASLPLRGLPEIVVA